MKTKLLITLLLAFGLLAACAEKNPHPMDMSQAVQSAASKADHEALAEHYEEAAAGSRYFCESFYGHPCPTSGKNYATANAFGGPSRPASLVAYTTRGMQHR